MRIHSAKILKGKRDATLYLFACDSPRHDDQWGRTIILQASRQSLSTRNCWDGESGAAKRDGKSESAKGS